MATYSGFIKEQYYQATVRRSTIRKGNRYIAFTSSIRKPSIRKGLVIAAGSDIRINTPIKYPRKFPLEYNWEKIN